MRSCCTVGRRSRSCTGASRSTMCNGCFRLACRCTPWTGSPGSASCRSRWRWRCRRSAPCRGLTRFCETNVRTYVRDAQGRVGIWFFSPGCRAARGSPRCPRDVPAPVLLVGDAADGGRRQGPLRVPPPLAGSPRCDQQGGRSRWASPMSLTRSPSWTISSRRDGSCSAQLAATSGSRARRTLAGRCFALRRSRWTTRWCAPQVCRRRRVHRSSTTRPACGSVSAARSARTADARSWRSRGEESVPAQAERDDGHGEQQEEEHRAERDHAESRGECALDRLGERFVPVADGRAAGLLAGARAPATARWRTARSRAGHVRSSTRRPIIRGPHGWVAEHDKPRESSAIHSAG